MQYGRTLTYLLFLKAYFDRSQCQTIFILLSRYMVFGSENDRLSTWYITLGTLHTTHLPIAEGSSLILFSLKDRVVRLSRFSSLILTIDILLKRR